MKIRSIIVAFILALASSPVAAETLTNEQIIQLSAAGLGDQVLIAKIRTSDSAFDTSTGALLALRKKGVSNAVIAEMISAGSGAKLTNSGPVKSGSALPLSADSPDPAVPHPPEIYLLADWRSPTRMLAIEPVTSERTRTGNIIAYVLTGGLVKRSRKAVLAEARAGVTTPRRRPAFYFFFDESSSGGSGAFWNTGSVASPADFSLVRFKVDDDVREAKVGSANIWGSNSGVSEKDRIAFAYSRISPGVYAVQPDADLEDGEYGFLSPFTGGGEAGGQRVRIFDFSVDGG